MVMPPACPGELHVSRYKGGYLESSSSPFPSGGGAAPLGNGEEACGESLPVSKSVTIPRASRDIADARTDFVSQDYDQGRLHNRSQFGGRSAGFKCPCVQRAGFGRRWCIGVIDDRVPVFFSVRDSGYGR